MSLESNRGILDRDIDSGAQRFRQRPQSGATTVSNQLQRLSIQKLENQFKEELNKFKSEMTEHKQDFEKVLDQLKTDAQKTIELRKSAELEVHKAQNERNRAGQVMSSRGAISARKILELKQLDDQRMVDII